MKKFFVFIFIINLFAYTAIQGQKFITLTDASGQNSRFYDNFATAFAAANSGDNVYFPAGTFDVSAVIINKPLNIFGVGYFSDSSKATGTTILNGPFTIATGADNGSLSGVYIKNYIRFGTNELDQAVSNYFFNRCNTDYLLFTFNMANNVNSVKNILVNECVIRTHFFGAVNHQNVKFTKCIFNGMFSNITGGAEFSNCLFLQNGGCITNYTILSSVTNCQFSNNIFIQSCYIVAFGNENNTFTNNLFTNGFTEGQLGSNTSIHNKFRFPKDSIFVKINDGSFLFTEKNNYHLRKIVNDSITGTDGKEVGIYGTNTPFKEGGIPLIPRIIYKNIAPDLKSDGKLNGRIIIEAQDN